ncbi:MAG: hypothetical protein L3J42_04960 [Hydrogenimonas sp.]|nr:hypothetical protein [Hydrogenimonas sp.]
MDEKRREKYLQTRYRRELERYLNRLVGYSMQDGFERNKFEELVDNGLKRLQKVEKVKLYSDYFERLESFVRLSEELKESGLDADEIAAKITHEANLIRKSKRKRSYSRKKRDGYDEEF